MTAMNVQIIKKNGKKEYAVLPYKEFEKIREKLADYEDIRCLREAKATEKDAATIGIAALKKKIAKKTKRSSRQR